MPLTVGKVAVAISGLSGNLLEAKRLNVVFFDLMALLLFLPF